jgi:hypothetical protein
MGPRTFATLLAVALVQAPLARADPSTDRAIEALGKDRSLKVRAQAALILGQRGSVDAVPALIAALSQDREEAVRIAAAAALGKIGDPTAREALDAARRSDPDGDVRAAAARALMDLSPRARGGARRHLVTVEEAQGKGGGAARSALHAALARHLAQRGFQVVGAGEGAAYRIKPSVLSIDVSEGTGNVVIAVKAAAVAVDEDGRMAAMIETGARLKASGTNLSGEAQDQLSARALDAAAKTLSEDLAAQLR